MQLTKSTAHRESFSFFIFEDVEIELAVRVVSKAYEEVALLKQEIIPTFGEIVDLCETLYYAGMSDIFRNRLDKIKGYMNLDEINQATDGDKMAATIAEAYLFKTNEIKESFFLDIKYVLDMYLKMNYIDTFSLTHLLPKERNTVDCRNELRNHPVLEVW